MAVTVNVYSQVTLTVDNTNNSGPGSLSDAVNQSNLNSTTLNPYTIEFDAGLVGSTIFLDGALILTGRSITINGDVDGDFRPDITIRPFGSSAISGFEVSGSDCTISYLHFVEFDDPTKAAIANTTGSGNFYIGNYIGTDPTGSSDGLAPNFYGIAIFGGNNNQIGDGTPEGANIIGNNSWGIYVQGVNGTIIEGNHIGIDVSGSVAIPNTNVGIELLNTISTIIGGALAGEGNIISGNSGDGIELTTASGTVIAGNYIGTDISGSVAIPNQSAGITTGSNSLGSNITQNVISGNSQWGIDLSNSSFDQITGNYIGTDASGTTGLGNNNFGIWVRSNSTNINIGDGTPAGRNIISGNSSNGILISGGTNTVIGNYIGLDVTGSVPIGNTTGGLVIAGGVDNVIGGEGDKRNVISANSYGIGVTVPDQFIYGNYIGTDQTGLVAIPNLNQGIRLTVNARNVSIGDGTALNANVISGNILEGILIDGSLVNSNNINFNYIGTGPGGTGSVGNGENGIFIEGDANTNNVLNSVIANNGTNGIEVNGIFAAGTAFNIFNSNSYFNNTNKAISVVFGAQNNIPPPVIIDNQLDGTVTGTSDPDALIEVYLDSEDEGELLLGSTFADASGNWSFVVDPAQVSGNLYYVTAVQTNNGNTSEFSNSQFLNTLFAVTNTNDSGPNSLRWVVDNANNIPGKDNVIFDIPVSDPGYTNNAGEEYWTIQPLTQLPDITESLVLDATLQPGTGGYKIRLDGQNTISKGLFFRFGNNEIYGMYITGFDAGSANDVGIELNHLAGGGSIIGAPGKGNVINNCRTGLEFILGDGMTVQGNIIGLDETGTVAMPNFNGISGTNSGNNLIGGYNLGEGNVISGNLNRGVFFNTGGSTQIIGNFIGTDITGLVAIGNNVGIANANNSNNIIRDNVISGNTSEGITIWITGNNFIQGNMIGVGFDGVTPMGNSKGIELWGTSTGGDNNLIGGEADGEANIIAYNANQGVELRGSNIDFNSVIANEIFCNGGLGIDLALGTPNEGNDAKSAPEITTVTATTVSGTGVDGDIIHVYRDITGCIPVQGSEYLGTTVVAGGIWSLGGLSLTGTEIINATATDSNGSTSQFAVDYPEIDVYVGADNTGIPVVDDQVPSVNLGSENIGTDLDVVFTVDNPSWVPLTLNSVTVADIEFSIVSAPLTVDPKSFENFTIRLDGSNYGIFATSVNIDNADPDESSFDYPVDGEIIMDFVVRNTNDVGVGSLRFTIDAANAISGTDNITFDIPISDPNYDAGNERWTISPATDLPALTETATIQGNTQPGTASYRVIIDGSGNASLSRGLELTADMIQLDGLYITGFNGDPDAAGFLVSSGIGSTVEYNLINDNTNGIFLTGGTDHMIFGNRIGTDPGGIIAAPNTYGVRALGAVDDMQIGGETVGNIISGNFEAGIWLEVSSSNVVVENQIGVDRFGNTALPNTYGIVLVNSDDNLIQLNVLSGNLGSGISLQTASNNEIIENKIGIGADGITPLGNETGISGGDSGNNDFNKIGRLGAFPKPNTIAYNTMQGILLDDANYDFNEILGNSIFCNGMKGIDLQGLGNDNIEPPEVLSFDGNELIGTAFIGHVVRVYTDDTGCGPLQGKTLIATTTAADAPWSVSGISLAPGEYLNLTATDPNGNTSEFAFDFGEIGVFEGPDNTGTAILDAQAAVVDMGTSFVGNDLLFEVTLENTSGAPLFISDVQADIPEISFINVPPVVEPFTSNTITIQLSGTVVSVYNSTITITSTDEDESLFTFDVTGTISVPEPEITVFEGPDNTGTEILSGQAGAVDLGSWFYSTSSSIDITIENTGVADLTISGISSSDIVFTVNNIPGTIAPGGSATFQVENDGLSSGVFSADITIQSDDSDEPAFVFPVTVSVSSAAILRVFEGDDIGGAQIMSGQGTPYDIGGIPTPTNLTGNVTLQNAGDLDLNISSITSSSPEFSISNNPGFIPPSTGGVATIDIVLDGTTPGVYTTDITIISDDPTQGTFVFPVTGTIQAPSILVFEGSNSSGLSINPGSNINLGTTDIDVNLVSQFTILNEGDAQLQVSDITIDNSSFTSSVISTTIDPGAEEVFSLNLDATVAGLFTGTVTINSNDPDLQSYQFDIAGEVLAPVVTVRENSQSGGIIDENTPIDVGTTPPSTLLQKVFFIENVGTQVLNIISIEIDNPLFTVENVPTSINSLEFGNFIVVFSADVLGPQQGTVTITTDAGTFTFFVTANVVDVIIYNVLSPNGDGIHDFLKIENIEFFSSNTVYIYTRWGDTIYKTDGYDNNSNVFSGVGNQGSVDEVAEGTYYYVVVYEYENSSGETVQNTLTGFFLIKR